MDPNRRTRLFSTIGIMLVIGGFGLFGYRLVTGSGILNTLEARRGADLSRQNETDLVSSPAGVSSSEIRAGLTGFDSIWLDGSWSVTLQPGEFEVITSIPDRVADDVTVEVTGDTLRLRVRPGARGVNAGLAATITLPDLESVEVDGSAEVRLERFDLDELEIEVDGAASITGVDNTVTELIVDVDGAASVDLAESRIVHAEVDLDGAARVGLFMDGGELTGEIDGLGSVTYSGAVADVDVDVDGLGRVRRHERGAE